MNKEETEKYLRECIPSVRIEEHPAVFTMEQMHELHLENEETIAKNLFLRDDKKRTWWLVSVRSDLKVDLKQLRKELGSRPLSFASENDLHDKLSLLKGSVTPLGVLNDDERIVKVRIDDAFCGSLIGVHPNENTATAWMMAEELIGLLKKHGTDASFFHPVLQNKDN